ncbi:MAG: cytochrome o ubiquinol oxidase subunit IV [Novosphingobium sp.]|nr:cytochrome o ubiquinol oxidase subunit IV [Novosphingobium sp.]
MANADSNHASIGAVVAGFGLSLVLTALSFGAVMSGLVPRDQQLATIVVLAVLQLLAQLVFFLHLGTAPEQRNTTVIFILTTLLIATVVSGSLWVMHNANANMTPMQMSVEMAKSRE